MDWFSCIICITCITCTSKYNCLICFIENMKTVNHSLTHLLTTLNQEMLAHLKIWTSFNSFFYLWKVGNVVFVFIVLGTLHLHRMQIYLTFMAKLIRQMDILAKSENPYLLIWDLISWITDFTWICFRIIHNIWNFECLCVSLLSFKLATFIGWHLWLLTK